MLGTSSMHVNCLLLISHSTVWLEQLLLQGIHMGTSGKTRCFRRFHCTGCLLKVIGCRRAPRIQPIERKKPITHKRAVDFTVLHKQNKHHNTVEYKVNASWLFWKVDIYRQRARTVSTYLLLNSIICYTIHIFLKINLGPKSTGFGVNPTKWLILYFRIPLK